MRPQWTIAGVLLLCLNATGCRMAVETAHNLYYETCLYVDVVKGKAYYCMLANSAWKTYQGEHPDCAGSADYAKGFKRGYADYLEYGDCSCRAMPPRRYWNIRYETPEGRASTVAWLDGFRAGAAAARASGYRELIVVPVGKSNLPPGGAPPIPPPAPSLGNGTSAPGMGVITPAEELPGPRPLPDEPLPPPPTPNDGG
jgi:hypothetical protein